MNVRFSCWTLAPKTRSRQITASVCHSATSAPSKAPGSPPCPPCSLPATTQLKLVTYREYQRPRTACAARRRLSLAAFFPFRPAWLGLWQSPRTSEGGSGGGLGRAATSRAYPRPHFDLRYCLLISTSQMLLISATKRQIPEGEGSVVGREEMKAEKSRIY